MGVIFILSKQLTFRSLELFLHLIIVKIIRYYMHNLFILGFGV